jgi:cell division GTPase FtsZ
VVARVARQIGALTVAVVSRPFDFEGRRRGRQAIDGLAELRAEVDTLIVIPNQRLLHVVGKDTPLTDAFAVADEVLLKATKGISDLVTVPGLVNLDFADVKAIMARRATRSWAPAARPARTAPRSPRTRRCRARCSRTCRSRAPRACCSTSRAGATSRCTRSTRRRRS